MAKKLTLNETWRLCLSMWRWIAEQKRAGKRRGVEQLKWDWVDNNWTGKDIRSNCFFCEYAVTHTRKEKSKCEICPGSLVDSLFGCSSQEYNFNTNPIAFYNKLVSLNRKRKK